MWHVKAKQVSIQTEALARHDNLINATSVIQLHLVTGNLQKTQKLYAS